MNEVMNGVMAKLSRYGLRESIKGARIDCMISIDGHASECMDITPPGPNVFSKALLHALEQPEIQFKPMILDGSAVAGRHVFGIDVRASRTRVGDTLPFDLYPDPGNSVPVESLPNYRPEPPTSTGNTPEGALFYGLSYVPSHRPFPFYPPEMEENQVVGAARAVCTIQLDGNLTNCRELDSTGSPAFGASLMTWLTTPGVRARPLLLNGIAVSGAHEFHMNFKLARGR